MTIKFIFLCVFLNFIEASFFVCCSCPQPFRSAGCGASNGYQQQQYASPSVVSKSISRPIVVNNPVEVPTVIEKHIPVIVPYHGSYDPFSPVEIEEVYVPVIYRPRPRPSFSQNAEGDSHQSKTSNQKPKPKNEDACYVNDSGFKCCNTDLEKTMHGAYTALKRSPTFNECNIGLMSKVVQKASQKRFQLSFEVVVSLKPFGSNSAYDGNYTCRFERDGKHFMSYASPTQYDSEDAKSESALSNTDITHDEDDIPPTEEEKEVKIENLNEGLKDIKPKEIEIKERLRRAADNGTPTFVENNCIIEFNKINSTGNQNGYVTHEITMGSLSPTISRRKRKSPTC